MSGDNLEKSKNSEGISSLGLSKTNVAILDYGLGNVGSIYNMTKRIGVSSFLAKTEEELIGASHLIIPGVGTFDEGMRRLNASGLREVLEEKVLVDCIPVLGICLGMQMMTGGSEEGELAGLNWVHGEARKFCFEEDDNIPVPHMGWSQVRALKDANITNGLLPESRFYFVHSYYVECNLKSDAILECTYGTKKFVAGFNRNNIYGVQFHPEKSHLFGMRLLQDFCGVDVN